MINSKHEIRSSKQIRNNRSNIVSDFEHLNLGFVSDFDIRISDLRNLDA